MKISALRQLLHDKNDEDDVFFVSFDGEPIDIQAHLYVPEWRSLYLGEEEEGLMESMMEYESNLTDEEKEAREKFDEAWDNGDDDGTADTDCPGCEICNEGEDCGASEGSDLGARCEITPKPDPHHDVDYEPL